MIYYYLELIINNNGIHAIADEINCGESGLSIRMFTPIIALSDRQVTINGEGSLLNRPMDFFDETLPQLGVEIESNSGKLPIKIQGPLQPKNIEIDGSLSSQFLTGLLMAYAAADAKDVSRCLCAGAGGFGAGGEPDSSGAVFGDGGDLVGGQAVAGGICVKFPVLPADQATVGSDPDITAAVFTDRPDRAARRPCARGTGPVAALHPSGLDWRRACHHAKPAVPGVVSDAARAQPDAGDQRERA